MPDLEERIAALEAAVMFPLRTIEVPPMSDQDVARFREEFEKAAGQPHRIIPQPPPLTPDEVRQLLRECVTVVKPGETLVIRGRNWTPSQVREIQQVMDAMREDGQVPFRTLARSGPVTGIRPA